MKTIEFLQRIPAPPVVAGLFLAFAALLVGPLSVAAEEPSEATPAAAQAEAVDQAAQWAEVLAALPQKRLGPFTYSEITVDWDRGPYALSPPYLPTYRLFEPRGPVGSYMEGGFFGGDAKARHVTLFPRARVEYKVKATSAPHDLALLISARWPMFQGPQPDSLQAAAIFRIDGADSLVVPITLQRGRQFFGRDGKGILYSFPHALLLDLPEGWHTIVLQVTPPHGGFATVTAGIPEGDVASPRGVLAAPDPSKSP